MLHRFFVRFATLTWMLLLLGASPSARAGEVELSLMECMRANIPSSVRVQEFDLATQDRAGGKRILRGRLFAQREENLLRASVKLLAPAELNGASYLMRESRSGSDEMYVFLPSVGRARRITGAGGGGPLFGTDISYADVKQIHNAFAGNAVKIDKAEAVQGRPAKLLSLVPKAGSGSKYQRIRAWVDDQSCLVTKAEFYEGNAVRKRMTVPATAIQQFDKHWYASELTMEDVKLGSRTTLKVTGVKMDASISKRAFDARNFFDAS